MKVVRNLNTMFNLYILLLQLVSVAIGRIIQLLF